MSAAKKVSDQFGGKKEDESGQSPEEIENDIKSTPTVTWDPFTVFPREIYLKIFNKLESADDKQNFMNAHQKWYDLFKAERTSFLFQNVCTTLALKEKIRSGKEKLLDLRFVCRDWDLGVQNYIQLYPSLFEINDEGNLKLVRYFLREVRGSSYSYPIRSDKFWNGRGQNMAERQLQKTLESHPPSKNPILTRRFVANLDSDYSLRRWWNQVEIFLETFGQHIWHCTLFFVCENQPDVYSEILKWLSLMPNLKTLNLHGFGWNGSGKLGMNEFNDRSQVPVTFDQLQVFCVNGVPAFLFNKLVGGMKNLEKLKIRYQWSTWFSLMDYQLGNLEGTLQEACLTLRRIEDFEYLRSLQQFPLLRRLIILWEFSNWRITAYRKWPEWKIVWNVLEEKFQALEDLDLRLPGAMHQADKKTATKQSLECRLHLPKLKKLRVVLPSLSSLDFLLPLKELESLDVILEQNDWNQNNSMFLDDRGIWIHRVARDLGVTEVLNFNPKDLCGMGNSDIWHYFWKLRKLRIGAVEPNQMNAAAIHFEKIGTKVKCINRYNI